MAFTIPWTLVASRISGDVGGYTIYTDRFGRPTVFPKDTPSRPPSPNQVALRDRFRRAQAAYMNLSDDVKKNFEDATKKLSMPLTGQNLFISASLRNNDAGIRTVASQSGIDLPTVEYVV